MGCCEYLVDVSYVVVHIVGEDDSVVEVEESSIPFLIRDYNIQRALETSRGVG